jgi:LCP family protein required for cell wall assembly
VPSTDAPTGQPDDRSPPGGWLPRGRTLRRALLAGLLALVLSSVTSTTVLLWADSKVDRVEVEGIEPVGQRGVAHAADGDVDLEDVVNILVVGSDAREGLSQEQRLALGTGDSDGDRTDTIMLVRLDPGADTVSLLSFPRDLLVTRCDGSRGRINAAYQVGEREGIGGPSCLVQTIADFSGLPVHHYVAVDFPGFIELVELVGGVTVYVEHPIDDWRANLDLDAGCHRLDGKAALGFVRHRASDSDYGRVARQQRFVKELVREATKLGNILNVPRALRMVETAAEAVQTDQDLSLELMRRIAFTFRELDRDAVVARTVPGDFQMIDGVAFEVPIEEQAEELFAAFQANALHAHAETGEGEVAGDGAAEPAEPAVSPGDVPPITVLNGAGIPGLAAQAQEQLEHDGFRVAGIDDADEFDRQTTEIRHPSDLADAAELLVGAFASAERVVEDRGGIVVVLGADYEPGAAGEVDAATDEVVEEQPEAPPETDQEFVGAQPPPAFCYD